MDTSKLSYKLAAGDREIKGALEVRRQVFVEEQGISEELEVDGRDSEALHMVVKDGERVIATARVLFLSASQAKIERMAVLQPFRRRGIGRRIISFLVEELKKKQVEEVFLHAQYLTKAFYRSVGFEERPSPFWEAGIKHVKMRKVL